ncbi:MAG: SRPBCC domain-containing protein [Chitinophagales bacterium]|nr:SRPBCC domain-containing protein [Chitinophagales bacterium]
MDVKVIGLYPYTKERIWKALTDPAEMRQWFFENMPDFQARVGFKTEFDVGSTNRSFHHIWEVLEVIENEKISYSWTYRDISGYSEVTFNLHDANGNTKLEVTCTGLDSFPSDIPEFTKESCTAGWNYFFNELKLYLSKGVN